LPGKVTQLSSKFQNTCATLDDGTVHCWGSALKRQLGPAVSINTVGSAPVLVPLSKGAARAEAGFSQSCAILQDGQLACWGSNQFGQLGNGTEVGSNPTPSLVQDTSGAPLSQVDALTIGEFHTCAAQSSGDLRCWGLRGGGVWGHTQGALVTSNKATLVASGAPILGLIAGQASTFVFREDRKLLAMGFNEEGQLGLTADLPKEAPFTYALFPSFTEVPGLGPVRDISHGSGEFACAIGTDDALSCWGENADGQLGAPISLPKPPPVTPQIPQARKVCAGGRNTCVIDLDGQLQCWGYNKSGQLGRGIFQDGIGDHIPAPVQWWSP
jgi:alpha-tubulin suppressor-like RCC1 family protein